MSFDGAQKRCRLEQERVMSTMGTLETDCQPIPDLNVMVLRQIKQVYFNRGDLMAKSREPHEHRESVAFGGGKRSAWY